MIDTDKIKIYPKSSLSVYVIYEGQMYPLTSSAITANSLIDITNYASFSLDIYSHLLDGLIEYTLEEYLLLLN